MHIHKVDLAGNVALLQPSYLSLATHAHCFVALNRIQCSFRGTEPLTSDNSFLDEAMVLLETLFMWSDGRQRQEELSSPVCLSSAMTEG
jgi:hypothetical protein